MPIRVLLADDHALVRQGIRSLLEKLDDIEVVGEVSDGRQALELSKTLNPDIAFMDITMPGLNGLEAVTRMKKNVRTPGWSCCRCMLAKNTFSKRWIPGQPDTCSKTRIGWSWSSRSEP